MSNFKHDLGLPVKDIVTGFSGFVLGRTQYLTGCNVYGVNPGKIGKDGKRPEMEWFDENRLKVVPGRKIVIDQSAEEATSGGPHSSDEFAPGK